MRLITISIASGRAFDLAASGDYVRVRSSAVDLTIEQPDSGEVIEVSQGDDFEFTPFSRLRVSHASGSTQTVKLIISKGKRAGSAQVSGSITVAGQNGAFTNANKTVTNASGQLLAANASRRYLLIQNNDSAGDIYVRLDGATATTATGVKIAPGGSYEIQGYAPTGAITAIGSIASNANVVTVEG